METDARVTAHSPSEWPWGRRGWAACRASFGPAQPTLAWVLADTGGEGVERAALKHLPNPDLSR